MRNTETHQAMLYGRDAEHYVEQLRPEFPEIVFHAAATPAELRERGAEATVLMAMAPSVTAEVAAALPRLRWIQALTTGVDTLLLLPDLPPGVVITRVRGIHGPQMSELAILDMLLLARNFPAMLANQPRRRWERWPQRLLLGRTVVILGVGAISEALAPRCQALGMRVVGVTARPEPPPGFDAVLPRARLHEAAAMADFLVLLLPYEPDTHHIVDAAVLAAMRPRSWVVNLARGAVLDEAALAEALTAGRLAGAALDVFAVEPLPEDSPLWEVPNLIITPHIGGMSDSYADQALPTVRENLRAFLRGDVGAMRNLVRG